jgi:hypothetical protein
MRQVHNFGDVRNERACCHCGDMYLTHGLAFDHIPSRILLDDPLPENMHKAYACRKCNNELSSHEEYLACLIECVLAGSTDVNQIKRPKVKKTLLRRPKLQAMIERSKESTPSGIVFKPEWPRVEQVAVKLARGHASYELNEPKPETPIRTVIKPLLLFSKSERQEFETPLSSSVWPEVGSRKMQLVVEGEGPYDDWTIVQPGRYRYMTSIVEGITIRCVLSEYLAIEVTWD